ncbi:hypothetical protein DFQ28_003001 [Apophysomyces sp. BC1034]|nr:hypothetical protein DFQ28_003001 [Apophysomyces sp. BC1034]
MTRLASARVDELSNKRLSDFHNTPRKKQTPPPLPPKTWKSHQQNGGSLSALKLNQRLSISASTTTGSFASDLSSCLQKNGPGSPTSLTADLDDHQLRQFKWSSNTPNTSGLRQHFSTKLPSSPSTLHIPAIPRSAIGTRVSSQMSSSSATTRARQYGSVLSNWLTGSLDDSPSRRSRKNSITILSKVPVICTSPTSLRSTSPSSFDDIPSPSSDKFVKRFRIIQELVETEKIYQRDMKLIKEIYYDPACASDSPLNKNDVRRVFSNLLAIIKLEDELVPRLEIACQSSCGDDIEIGGVFRDMMDRLADVYAEFCKRHQDAIIKLQEFENRPGVDVFLRNCETRMQGRTTCWDLGSLLIKPVQRVLKYPLLLRELCGCTPTYHPDHMQLVAAAREMEQVAEHINEMKLRKDMVDKIVNEKKKPEFRVCAEAVWGEPDLMIGAMTTRDARFDTLHARFQSQQDTARQLTRDVQGWVRRVKDHFDRLCLISTGFDELYGSSGGVRVKSMSQIREWSHLMSTFPITISQELDFMMQGHVHDRINVFLQLFNNPAEVISKRAQSLLDYDRVQDIKSKGGVPDKQLQASADAYAPINAQLVDELPKFIELATRYFEILIGELAMVQSRFMAQATQEWQKLVAWPKTQTDGSFDAVISNYLKGMIDVQERINDIKTIDAKRRQRQTPWEEQQQPCSTSSRSSSSSSGNSRSNSSRRSSNQGRSKMQLKDDMDRTPSLLSFTDDGKQKRNKIGQMYSSSAF